MTKLYFLTLQNSMIAPTMFLAPIFLMIVSRIQILYNDHENSVYL